MAKKYYWEIPEKETDFETGEETGNIITHKIELICSNLTGAFIITIDGTKFSLKEKPFALKKAEQMFRLGDMPAIISFDSKCVPKITADDEVYLPIKK
jgi:hypothetical protein